MKFSQYPYARPDEQKTIQLLGEYERRLAQASSYGEFKTAFDEFDAACADYDTQESIASVHYTMNTQDPFWAEESDYFDAVSPKIADARTKAIGAVLDSSWRKELEKEIPQTWFALCENARATISDAIIEELQEENRLASAYQKLIGSAQVEFEGKKWTLSALSKPMNDRSRERRKAAHQAYWNWFADNEEKLAELFDGLVKVRTKMARKMGYDNYLPFGYKRMNRLDYGMEDVKNYREEILEQAVSLAQSLYEKQAERLHVPGDKLLPWDEKVEFEDGSATPKPEREEMVKLAGKMYADMAPAAGSFFAMMQEEELMDLEGRPGKAAGGYCTSFPNMERPFIFASFNQTKDDVEVLTHEAGHAFQNWQSRHVRPHDLVWPTMESAEIHSMSMEFLTWPWMEDFFEEDTEKFWYAHLADAIKFLPYGALVDHFQHEVYAHPDWTHEERMSAWRRLEKQYLPHKDYSQTEILERGGWWMRQLHIFLDPLYYIDYTLAQAAALQFWKRMIDQDPRMFEDYLAICKAGGTLPFSQIVKTAHLNVPFEKGALAQSMQAARDWFEHPERPKKWHSDAV